MRIKTPLNALKLLTACLCLAASSAWAQAPNSKTNYLLEGQVLSPWHAVIGDESEWYQPIKEEKQTSKNKAVIYEKVSEDGKSAAYIYWKNKKKDASFSLSGQTIDLSTLPDTIGLAIEMKMHSKLRNALTLSMDCGYPCRGSLNLKPLLSAYPTKEWITLPIPLRCFSQAGTDLSKVDSPLHLQTKGKFKMSLGSVRLIQLPEDFALCR